MHDIMSGNTPGGINDKFSILTGYLSRGWALVPLHDVTAGLCSCGRDCGTSAGKHPRWPRWQEASQLIRDERTLSSHLRGVGGERWNWGVATGPASGIWVLDVDPASGGEEALRALYAELAAEYETLPATLELGPTGGGGRHLVFAWPTGVDATGAPLVIHGSQTKNRYGLAPGLDIRGAGGQIVVAPSVSAKGPYGGVLVDAPVYPVGPVLLARLTGDGLGRAREVDAAANGSAGAGPRMPAPPAAHPGHDNGAGIDAFTAARYRAYAEAAAAGLLAELRAAPTGTRNDTAYRTACRLVELLNAAWSGLDPDGTVGAWWKAGLAHPDGARVPADELDGVWQRAVARVGGEQAAPPGDDGWAGVGGDVVPFSSISPAGALVSGGQLGAPAVGELAAGGGGDARASSTYVDDIQFSEPGRPAVGGQYSGQLNGRTATGPTSGPVPDRSGQGVASVLDPVEAMLSRLLTSAQLRALPPPEPLINGLLDLDSCAWLIGEPGSGKSFVALDFAAHVGRGEPWHGRTVRQGRVVYIVAEGARGMRLRVDAWERERAPMDDVFFLPEPVQANERGPRGMPVAGAWSVLVEACRRVAPALVIIDTQARATVGLNENDNSDMSYYAAQADRIRRATGACVLSVHHLGRNGTHARGASAIDGAQDTELRIERRPGAMAITLKVDKQKDQAEIGPVPLELIKIDLGVDPATGRDLSSLVIGQESPDASMFTEPGSVVSAGQRRMIALYQLIVDRFNAGDGGTKSEIKKAFLALPELAELKSSDGRDRAWSRAWSGTTTAPGLVPRGLIAKRAGAEKFKIIVLPDQTAEGCLTPNSRESGQPAPAGWNVYWPDEER